MWDSIVNFWKACYAGIPFTRKAKQKKKLTHDERVEERRRRRERR